LFSDDRFCRGCGAPQAVPGAPLFEASSTSFQQPTGAIAGASENREPLPHAELALPEKSNRRIATVLAALVVLLVVAFGAFAVLEPRDSGRASTAAAVVPLQTTTAWTTPTTAWTTPTTSLRIGAITKRAAAFGREQAALAAVKFPTYGSASSEYTLWWDAQARAYQGYQADIEAIDFPDAARQDANQLIRDLSVLIVDVRELAYNPAADANQASVDNGKVEGDEQVLGTDLEPR